MALQPMSLLFLGAFALFVHGVWSQCNVTCSTDFEGSLNCSCSLPTSPVHIQVTCRDDGDEAEGGCDVGPTQSWCEMRPEHLNHIGSVETLCTATVSPIAAGVRTNVTESSSWALRYVVKPPPPSNVQVTNMDGAYNITWDHSNIRDFLQYQVRIRESKDSSKEAGNFITDTQKELVLVHGRLQPHVNYIVDVRAKLLPGFLYAGPWSEWSDTVDWTTEGPEGFDAFWLYVVLPIIVVTVIVVFLGFSQKLYLLKKFQLFTFIPKPDVFFEPLYQDYGGDFKEWVKPVFSEYDYRRTSSWARTPDEKMHNLVLQLKKEQLSYREDDEVNPAAGGRFLRANPHGDLPLSIQNGGGSSQGAGHSTGHVSIHTVTLSGEEEDAEEVSLSSVHTLRSYHDGESFGSFEEDSGVNAGFDLAPLPIPTLGGQIMVLPLRQQQPSNVLSEGDLDFHPNAEIIEPERVSLVSFASNEQSEDGYPRVDLDTIDSGFGECSSPGASDSSIAEQINSDLFREHKNSNSNYVKQWMVCGTRPEDGGNEHNEHNEYDEAQ